jgi:hypothetical protein
MKKSHPISLIATMRSESQRLCAASGFLLEREQPSEPAELLLSN